MIDQTTPPFAVGDVAYARASSGGYVNAAAVPVDPAFSGNDRAFACPALGGDFQPGSGKPNPTASPISKGSDADGGAADIAAIPRIDVPVPPAPPAAVEIAGSVSSTFVVFVGKASKVGTVDVVYTDPVAGTPLHVITNIAVADTAGMIAAKVTARLNENGKVEASQTSNAVQVLKTNGKPVAGLGVVVTLP